MKTNYCMRNEKRELIQNQGHAPVWVEGRFLATGCLGAGWSEKSHLKQPRRQDPIHGQGIGSLQGGILRTCFKCVKGKQSWRQHEAENLAQSFQRGLPVHWARPPERPSPQRLRSAPHQDPRWPHGSDVIRWFHHCQTCGWFLSLNRFIVVKKHTINFTI